MNKPGLDIVALEDARALPSQCYTDAAYWQVDRETILASQWQYVGPASSVENPGQVLCTELLGKPIIVSRTPEHKLLAFYNVCRHRGGPLVRESGQYRRLQCAYHGWTYALDGRLIGAPHMQAARGFDPNQCSLRQLSAQVWEGMLFVAQNPPEFDVDAIMAGINERILPMRLREMTFVRRDEYSVRCNWKIYIDNYLEGYHVPFVHPGLNKVLDFANYKTELAQHYSLQHSPVRPGDNPYSNQGGHAYYYFVLPNIMFNILPGRLQVNAVLPIDIDHCRVIFDYYYSGKDDATRIAQAQADLAFSDDVQKEDIAICEILQKNMRAGVYEAGRLSPTFESALHHFQNSLKLLYLSVAP